MRKEDINIIKLKKKINWKKKNELKHLILKTLSQNKSLSITYRNYAYYLLTKRKNNFFKFKNICLKNNKASSINNHFYLSKYSLKNYLTFNKAQNCKINSW